MGPLFALLAVHISDGVLNSEWVIGGLVLMALLMVPAVIGVRDEEIPRIALLTAAFFVASQIHVSLGPTSVHLLLNGLVGVILGCGAGLAIPVGLALQAMLFSHGGLYATGVNACVMTIPALACGGLFAVLRRVAWLRHSWFRGGLVALVLITWAAVVLFVTRLLLTNPRQDWADPDPYPALRTLLHPFVLLALLALGVIGAVIERRLETTPNAILGFLIGFTGVMLTLVLNAFVLMTGGAADWRSIVVVVLIAHLPIAVLEGIIMGFTVSFLSRVKPDLLVGWQAPPLTPNPSPLRGEGRIGPLTPNPSPSREEGRATSVRPRSAESQAITPPSPVQERPSLTLLLAVAGVLFLAVPARAHRLEAEVKLLPDGRLQVESWFETGDSPRHARVQVFLGDRMLAEGTLDDEGKFIFQADRAVPLRVVVNAGAGHRKELIVAPREVGPAGTPFKTDDTLTVRAYYFPYRDVLAGIGFLLALGAFVLSLRNAAALKEIQQWLRSGQRKSDQPGETN